MALEAIFRELFSELRKLKDTLVAVRLTVVEDKPVTGEAALVDHMEDTILDIMGSLDEALKAARSAPTARVSRTVGSLDNPQRLRSMSEPLPKSATTGNAWDFPMAASSSTATLCVNPLMT